MSRTETWLDVMPVVPLARAVPVVGCVGGRKGVAYSDADERGRVEILWDQPHDGPTFRNTAWEFNLRVDLDDEQGFAYALRLYAQRNKGGGINAPDEPFRSADDFVASLANAWLWNSVTDADRLALARALRELA